MTKFIAHRKIERRKRGRKEERGRNFLKIENVNLSLKGKVKGGKGKEEGGGKRRTVGPQNFRESGKEKKKKRATTRGSQNGPVSFSFSPPKGNRKGEKKKQTGKRKRKKDQRPPRRRSRVYLVLVPDFL